MESKIARLEEKLDEVKDSVGELRVQCQPLPDLSDSVKKIESHLSKIDITLLKQEHNLEKHMLRTDQNELLISMLNEDMKPIKKYVGMFDGILKAVGIISVLAGAVLTLYKLYYYIAVL